MMVVVCLNLATQCLDVLGNHNHDHDDDHHHHHHQELHEEPSTIWYEHDAADAQGAEALQGLTLQEVNPQSRTEIFYVCS